MEIPSSRRKRTIDWTPSRHGSELSSSRWCSKTTPIGQKMHAWPFVRFCQFQSFELAYDESGSLHQSSFVYVNCFMGACLHFRFSFEEGNRVLERGKQFECPNIHKGRFSMEQN
jgi:hypothetical protein